MILFLGMLIVVIPLLGIGLYGVWYNKQVDKYNEEQEREEAEQNMAA